MPIIFRPVLAIDTPFDAQGNIQRTVDRLDVPSGTFSIRSRQPESGGVHPVSLDMTAEQFIEFEWFLKTVRGRWKSFWLPSFQEDFVPIAPLGASDTEVVIKAIGYTDFEFPQVNKRNIVFISHPGPDLSIATVTGSVDNGNGTETLTLSDAVGVEFPLDMNHYISYLWHCRLNSDDVQFQWIHEDAVTATFEVKELLIAGS